MSQPDLSVVIPTYNEAKRIGDTLLALGAYFRDKPRAVEILVSDDGSGDATRDQVAKFSADSGVPVKVVGDGVNRGKGYAVRRGMLEAAGKWLLFSDADLSTPISELEVLLEAVRQGAQVAIGSRALRDSRILVHQDTHRELSGKAFNGLVQTLLLPGLHDTQCGFKLFTREAAQAIFPRAVINGFCFDVEILYLARRMGFLIREVPVSWVNSPDSRVKFLVDPAKMFIDLIRIRLKDYALA